MAWVAVPPLAGPPRSVVIIAVVGTEVVRRMEHPVPEERVVGLLSLFEAGDELVVELGLCQRVPTTSMSSADNLLLVKAGRCSGGPFLSLSASNSCSHLCT